MGVTLQELDKLGEAIAAYHHGLEIRPVTRTRQHMP